MGGIFIALVIIAVVALLFAATSLNRPTVNDNTVLVLNVTGELPDFVPDDPLAKALGFQQPQSFTGLLTQLRKAKVDGRISAVLLDINFPGIGWAKADELRDAIADFKYSGKPVYAYMEIGSNREYYIATAADRIFLPPPGDLYINGFAAEAMFFKGSLDKLGIEADVIQIGPKYKNAPDQYTRKEMSEGQREVINAVLDEYFSRFTNAIAEARKKPIEDVKAAIDTAPHNAAQAVKLGLIDGALYREDVDQELLRALNYREGEPLRTIKASQYKEIPSESLGLNNGEKVAVIFASGPINVGRSSNSGPFSSEMIGSDTVVKAVNDAANDKTVKAIVLRVDSPGGSALASDLIWNALEKAKKNKPVVVSMADAAASGGYYISCNANKIVAQPTTITGSIGVFLGKPVVKGLYDWLGVTSEYVTRGRNAGIFRETEKWTAEEREKMTDQANVIYYDNFLPKVANGRGRSVEEIDTVGQGRVWTGSQAKERGLVDEFGGLEKAISIARDLAGLPADKDVRRVVFPAPRPFIETLLNPEESALFSSARSERVLSERLPSDVRRALRHSYIFERMKKGDAMLILPFDLRIN